jgi:ATP-binding cassette subfamily B protein
VLQFDLQRRSHAYAGRRAQAAPGRWALVSQGHATASGVSSSGAPPLGRRTLWEALHVFWSSADGYAKRRLLLALFLVAGSALLAALAPIALKLVVDALAGGPQSQASLATAGFVLLYVLGQFLSRVLNELRMLVFGQGEQRVRRRIGARLFEHLVRLPMRLHLERKTGTIGETVEQGLHGYQMLLTHLVYTLLPAAVEFCTVAAVLLHYQHETYLLILGAASIAYVLAFQRGAADIQTPARIVSEAHIEAHAVLTDSLINYEAVKYFDAESVVCTRYDEALSRTECAWRGFYRRRAVNGVLVATIFAVSLGASLVYAAQDVLRGAMTIGGFVLVNTYVLRLMQPLELLGVAVRDIAQGLAFLERLLALLRAHREGEISQVTTVQAAPHGGPELRDGFGPPSPLRRAYRNPSRGELQFEDVTFSYRPGRAVLKNVSFRAPAGRTIAVVGASGAGKSSLIRLLFRLYEPDSGRILLDGAPIAQLPLSLVRQAIAVVPQDTALFHDTVARNIGFGRSGSSQPEIEEAARIANLHEFIMGLPDGYETIVGERGLKLSGGERQRVAIARAVLKRPHVFVFDEATSSLDSRTEREILSNVVDISRECTTLVIAHRLSTVVHANEILVFDSGAVVERGSHGELLARRGRYATLWRAQAEEQDVGASNRSPPHSGSSFDAAGPPPTGVR